MQEHHLLPQPTKLWEGKVFTSVCLSVILLGGSHVTIIHDAFDLTAEGRPISDMSSLPALPPDILPGTPPDIRPEIPLLLTSGGQHWRLVQACSLEDPLHPPPSRTTSVVATEAHMVYKRALCILLECFLIVQLVQRWNNYS